MSSPSRSAAFRALFDAYERPLRVYCHRRLPPTLAEDAAAEVFLVMWRRLDEVPEGSEGRLWLYGIARNVIRNKQRSLGRNRRLQDLVERQPTRRAESPEEIVVRSTEDERLWDALNGLRDAERELVLLRSWEGLSSADIGAVLGITPKAVDNRLGRIRKKLQKRLGDYSMSGADPQPTAGGDR